MRKINPLCLAGVACVIRNACYAGYAVRCARVVTWYMGSGLKAQNMTGIRAQKNGIRDHKAFEAESGIRSITRSKNLLSQYFSALIIRFVSTVFSGRGTLPILASGWRQFLSYEVLVV